MSTTAVVICVPPMSAANTKAGCLATFFIRTLLEQVIRNDQCRHGFYDDDRAWYDAGIMSPATGNLGRLPLLVDRLLGLHNRCHRLECRSERDVHAVRNTALYTARKVGQRLEVFFVAVGVDEDVVVFGAFHLRPLKAGSVFETVYGIDAEHGFAEVSMQFIEHRFA